MDETDDEDEDDTAERMDVCGEAPAAAPAGFVYSVCPPLAGELDLGGSMDLFAEGHSRRE